MVCKEDVFLWFKDLNGSRRIDFVCGLLNMCVPFELRYFGTCIEDLCKKDYQYLRDVENRANNIHELSKFEDLADDITRSKLIVSLALLQSSNHVCSNVIFKILTDSEKMDSLLLRITVYQKIVDEIFLLFTMALNHPAFTFDQKSSLGNQLKVIEKLFNGYELEPRKESPLKWRIEQDIGKSNPSHCTALCSSGSPQKYLIKNLEVKNKPRKKGDKHNDYRLKVHWASGEVTELIKTNQEMKELVSKLNQLRIQALNEQSQGLNIPNMSCVQSSGHIEDNEDGVSCQYLNQIFKKAPLSLPEYELLLSFIQGISHHVPVSQHCLTPSVSSETVTSQSVTSSQTNPSLVIQTAALPTPVNSGPTPKVAIDGNKGKGHTNVPGHTTNIGLQGNTNISSSTPVFQIPASCMSPVTSSSPLTSPLSSPYASPSQSGTSSRSASPWTHPATDLTSETNMLKQLFKKEKLVKYWEKLQCYSADELRSLSDEDLLKEGLTMGAISRFRKMLENFRNRTLNGINIHPLESNAATSVIMTPVTCTSTTSVASFPVSVIASVSQALVTTVSGGGARTVAHLHSYPPISHFHTVSQNSLSNSMVGTVNTTTGCSVNLHSRQPLQPSSLQRPPMAELQPQPCPQVQHLSQQTPGVNGDSSPTCSEYSSPPCSPSLDNQSNTNNFDSSCSDENEKDKELDKSRILDRACVQHKYGKVKERSKTCDIISKSGKMAARLRITDDSHLVPPISASSSVKSSDGNSKPIRPTTMPDILPVSVSGNSAAVNTQSFPRSRVNSTVSSNTPSNIVNTFKTGPVNATVASSPVRNTNSGTIIFENSQLGKTLSANSPNTPSVNRWDVYNGSCGPANNQNSQVPVSNVVVTPCTLSQKESVTSRTSNSVVTTTNIISTTAQHSQVSSVNMLNVRHNKTASNQHIEDHKAGNSNHPSTVTSATTCLPCVGPGADTNHPNTHYPPTPISYPSLPSTPVAPTTVTYATPAFIPLVTGQTSTNPSAGPPPQSQVPHNHGVTAVVSTGCSNACVCSCSCTTQPGNLAYSPGFLPLHMSSTMFPGFHGFLQPHSTNGFISPSLPNFSFTGSPLAPGTLPNGITPELMYQSTQYSLLQQNGSQHSSQATPGFITGPAPNIGFHGNYSNPANQPPVVKNKISCYNCGVMGHRGLECKESSMEEITKPGHYRLNYIPTPKPMENSE